MLEEWKKYNSSNNVFRDIQEPIQSIEYAVNSILDTVSNILNHAKYTIEQQIGSSDPFFNQNQFREKYSQLYSKNINTPIVAPRVNLSPEKKRTSNTECPICHK